MTSITARTAIPLTEQASGALWAQKDGQIYLLREVGETAVAPGKHEGTPAEVVRARSWLPADVPMGALSHWPAYIYRYGVWWPQGEGLDAKVRTFFQVPRSGALPETWAEEQRTQSDGTAWRVATFDATQKDAESLLPAQLIADADLATSVHFAQWRHPADDAQVAMQRTSRQPSGALTVDLAPGDLYQTSITALADERGEQVTQGEAEAALDLP